MHLAWTDGLEDSAKLPAMSARTTAAAIAASRVKLIDRIRGESTHRGAVKAELADASCPNECCPRDK